MSATNAKPLLVCLMGPTASGKTDLAIGLAQALACELISVDSALVYRGLDIGSAKPDYPHHLVNIREPNEVYSAADFVADAHRLVQDVSARGKVPLLVGGTMMYFKAFLEGLSAMPAANPEVRRTIEAEAGEKGWPRLHQELARVDPEAAARIHPNHSQRLCRALEVFRSSGVTLTEWQARAAGLPLPGEQFRIVQLAVCPAERRVLHERIARRFEQMVAAGMLAEVAALRARGDLTPELPAVRAVGYRQLWEHLEGSCSEAEAVEKAIIATRQLAKRQLTWLRKWPNLNWIYTNAEGNIAAAEGSHSGPGSQKPLELALKYLQIAPN